MPKLLNLDADVPETYFVFVNQMHPVTEHAFKLTGRFTSGAFSTMSVDPIFAQKYLDGKARYLPYAPCSMDLTSPSMFFLSAINEYRIEYDAEVYREKHVPLYPSRLSATYAFADLETCHRVSAKYHWPLDTVHRFKLLPTPLNRVVRVNMEHISVARHAFRVASWSDTDPVWQSYWSGQSDFSVEVPGPGFRRIRIDADVIWEYLIEGVLERIAD